MDLAYIYRKTKVAMTTLTFEVEVDEETAERFRQNEQERLKVNLLIKTLLLKTTREEAKERLRESMNRLSDEAKKNGLTEEKLAEILEEIDRERD